jgi:hypothetical protein
MLVCTSCTSFCYVNIAEKSTKTPRYSRNIANVGIEHQLINQNMKIFFLQCKQPCFKREEEDDLCYRCHKLNGGHGI